MKIIAEEKRRKRLFPTSRSVDDGRGGGVNASEDHRDEGEDTAAASFDGFETASERDVSYRDNDEEDGPDVSKQSLDGDSVQNEEKLKQLRWSAWLGCARRSGGGGQFIDFDFGWERSVRMYGSDAATTAMGLSSSQTLKTGTKRLLLPSINRINTIGGRFCNFPTEQNQLSVGSQHHQINCSPDFLNTFHFFIVIIIIMENEHQPIIPGLPDDLALICLAKLSHGYYGLLQSVSKKWRDTIRSEDYANYKMSKGLCGDWLFVLTESSENQWIAYDPLSDRWHPLPVFSRPTHFHNWKHVGFSCVCVSNRLLVIGGSYELRNSTQPFQKSLITNEVMQFDPFTNQWSRVASMITPRAQFACNLIDGKVYVAGGRNLFSGNRGLLLAEVYDPLTDRWEELPPMPQPQMDCIGLSHKGKLLVISDQVGLPGQQTSYIFDPSNDTWTSLGDIWEWPFSRAIQYEVHLMGDGQLCTVVEQGESHIKMRDIEEGEWYDVGSIPSITLSDHARALEPFGYRVASWRNELYILGGRVLKWEEFGSGMFKIVRLRSVRVCNPLLRPLQWKETRPMCLPASGSILGCASMEEKNPS
ncbi:F-box/kelch-repeat protein At1g16250 [Rutidosis leptorrhynchoides]|uniref:F-box/kelch-repeat protein At1g16250 n=1 Tax=Rutidosis leptorrhynchoides TaxID=125765 RepID=UPI003A99E46E